MGKKTKKPKKYRKTKNKKRTPKKNENKVEKLKKIKKEDSKKYEIKKVAVPYKNLIKNWELPPIKSIDLLTSIEKEESYNHLRWKDYIFQMERLNSYDYMNIYSMVIVNYVEKIILVIIYISHKILIVQ